MPNARIPPLGEPPQEPCDTITKLERLLASVCKVPSRFFSSASRPAPEQGRIIRGS